MFENYRKSLIRNFERSEKFRMDKSSVKMPKMDNLANFWKPEWDNFGNFQTLCIYARREGGLYIMPSRSLLEAFFEPLLGWSRRFRMSLAFKRASLNGKVSKLSQWFRYSLHIFKRTCLTLLYMKREKNVQVQGLTQKWAWVWVWGRGRGGVELNGECVQKRTFFSINHSKTWEELGRWRPSFFS